jgi:hypothetical protein
MGEFLWLFDEIAALFGTPFLLERGRFGLGGLLFTGLESMSGKVRGWTFKTKQLAHADEDAS